MKPMRAVSLLVSVAVVLFLLGGGLAVKVGAEENSFHQVVVFSEVLSLVLDNYVDPLEAERLLASAYEGMLGGLDAHGAFLTPEELAEWKNAPRDALADPGFSVLQAGRALQIVAVVPDSAADLAGLKPGDQIRSVDGRPVRELSLDQSWRLLHGAAGTTVTLDVLRTSEDLRREELELTRSMPRGRTYELSVRRGTGVLRLLDPSRINADELAAELDDVRSRGVDRLLLDVRNVADIDPRGVTAAAGLFVSGPLLELEDREGKVIESLLSTRPKTAWDGSITVLVNGATAGSAEALAALVRSDLDGKIVGEETYGLGSEAELYEMGNGTGLIVSAAVWRTPSGERWNGDGLEPDEVIRGKGTDYAERLADQLEQALEFLEEPEKTESAEAA